MSLDINHIRNWPPGSLMVYDSRNLRFPSATATVYKFQGIGIVIANDGKRSIRVVWDARCNNPFVEYDVTVLNVKVISRV